jgi:osmoprotectant transport system permease protein
MRKAIICALFFLCPFHFIFSQNKIVVGAKHFNEGYILSEMIAQLLENKGFTVERKFNLGGTAISFEALKNAEIDVYPEYSGTISSEILKSENQINLDDINKAVHEKYQLETSKPYGFNNTYALLMRRDVAEKEKIKTIQDLAQNPHLRGGLSYEFLKRKDGWANLAKHYALPQTPVGIEHGLAYQAIHSNELDFTDAYSTDGEIKQHNLVLLTDNLNYFPSYYAVSFYKADFPEKVKQILNALSSQISNEEMQALNAEALLNKKNHFQIARQFLIDKKLINEQTLTTNANRYEFLAHIWEHIKLTSISLFLAIIVALPLGVLLYQNPKFAKPILYVIGVLQTIPSIALLAFMIPLIGIGFYPATVALFIYALLPILRNTIIGLYSIDPQLKNVASAIGLNAKNRLLKIEIPLAMPAILSGIRTAAVINIGTATLAAFIGAGGLGEYIVTGLALNNLELILKGAIPSALLAIAVELIFEGIDYIYIPKHLKQNLKI